MSATLPENEELFHLLVDGVKDYAIFMLDPSGRVASWNSGAERIKGYRAEEILGEHFSIFYPTDAIERGWPEHELEVAQAEGRFEDEGWRLRKDGSRFWANVVITPLYDRENRLRGYAKVTRDLTERRRIAALEDAERYMSEFLAMLAHELRNPLAPIRNAASAIRVPGVNPSVLEWCGSVIDRQVTHLSRLVEDLLDVSRIATGKISFQKEKVDFVRLVASAVDSSRTLIDARQLTLELVLPDQPLPIEGDITRLSQIVLNLLSNAAKFTPNGGHIRVALERQGGRAVMRVRDTGIGISAELLPRIFELFMQGDRTLDRREGGLGIGLTLVKRLAALHGGEVEAHSEGLGHGSEFVVRLPLTTAEDGRNRAGAVAYTLPPNGCRRVLVVDDSPDAAETMAMLVRAWGHEVRTCGDGRSAVVIAEDFRPDVVLLDIGLPGMDGLEVARYLRRLPLLKDATLVATTGYSRDADRRQALEAGFDVHLTKPVDLAQIQQLIASAPALPPAAP